MPTLLQFPPNPPAPAKRTSSGAMHRLAFPALGTTCEVQYAGPKGGLPAVEFELAAVRWVMDFEKKYSRFRPGSLVSRINAAAGKSWVAVDPEMEDMLRLCDSLHAMTQGILDATALPLIKLWNWKADYPVVPSPEQIAATRQLTGWTKVRREPGRVFLPEEGMALDFGGFGKEYAVDLVTQMAASYDLTDVLVDFGHDLRAIGTPPGRPAWHIGLEDPAYPGQIAGSLAISGCAVASSGDYVRCFRANGQRYGHIIDPRTGRPVANGCSQATVVAASCLQAGALSTTAFVLGLQEGTRFIQQFPGSEGLIVAGHKRAQTPGFFHYAVSP